MRTRLVAGLLLATTTTLVTACSTNPYPQIPGAASPATSAPVADASDTPAADQPASAAPDDLAKGSAQHTVHSNGLTVRVDYSAPVPARWTSDAGTSLQLSVSVHNDRRPKQKIYLTRATVRVVVSDGSAYLPSPDPLVENANLSPGYLATSPYGYVQSFSVPGLDQSARVLVIDVRLELVSLVGAKAKDYTKTSITDSVQTAAQS